MTPFLRTLGSWLLLGSVAYGCSPTAADLSPEQTVEEFILRMQSVHGDAKAARAAYELLWNDARRNLAERAKRASAVAGREIGPEEMLTPSRFTAAFKPKHFKAQVQNDRAEVTVTGDSPGTQKHRVLCVREDNHWRVVLTIPPLPPVQKRPDATSN